MAEAILNRKGRPVFTGVQRGQPSGRSGPAGGARAVGRGQAAHRWTAQQELGRVCAAGRAGDGFRLHRMRSRGAGGVPGVAGPADDRALGRARPGCGRPAPRRKSNVPSAMHFRFWTVASASSFRFHSPVSTNWRSNERLRTSAGSEIFTGATLDSGMFRDGVSGGCGGRFRNHGRTARGRKRALALLANTIATGAALVALVLTLAEISGAHLNPAVTLSSAAAGGVSLEPRDGARLTRWQVLWTVSSGGTVMRPLIRLACHGARHSPVHVRGGFEAFM